MTAHLTINGAMTCCSWRLGEVAADSYTTDPEQLNCPECYEFLSRPQYGEAEDMAYSQGYADGMDKSFSRWSTGCLTNIPQGAAAGHAW